MIEPRPGASSPAAPPPPSDRRYGILGWPGARLVPALLVAMLALPWAWNEWQWWRGTGVYACGWQGTVVSARPTVLSVTDFLTRSWGRDRDPSRYRWDDGRGTGHYIAVVDDAATLQPRKVAISGSQYRSLPVPSYLACTPDKGLQLFPDQAAARAAGLPPP